LGLTRLRGVISRDDEAAVAAQLGREPRAIHAVGHRCPCGNPDVVTTEPRLPNGTPFPTTYYMTCPQLVAAIARIEAAGGVERWSRAAQEDSELADSLRRATEEQRALRAELAGGRRGRDEGASLRLGIGGSASPGHLKCLHAHAAYALARPGYALGERILAEIEPLWPPERCCSELLDLQR
jgi:uncharacterized protein